MSLHLIFGPMFSFKTRFLLTEYERYRQKGLPGILVNFKRDIRYGTERVSTHSDLLGTKMQAEAVCCFDLNAIREKLFAAFVIAIDEIQFFPNCVALITELLQAGKKIFVAGLDSDFRQMPFPGSCLFELVPLAMTVQKLHAVCDFCPVGTKYHKAPMSWRIVSDESTELIGGGEKYGAICRPCIGLPVKVKREVPAKPV